MLIVPDTHRPYHDQRAWDLMLQVAQFLAPYYLIVVGDLADFYSVSAHSKDPKRAFRLDAELEDVNLALDELDALGAIDKRFIAGNHEDRLQRYLQDKAPELFPIVEVPKLFRLAERGWTYIPYKHDTRIGKLHLTHDVEAVGRNAAFKALDTYQHSIVTGHTHRLQYLVEGNATGEVKLSAQFGWLGDADKIDYMHRVKVKKDWALGFGVGFVNEKTGIVYLTPIPIVPVGKKYTAVVHGRYFEN